MIVGLLPTKERVYRELLKRAGYLEQNLRFVEAIEHEDLARSEMIAFLRERDVEFIDLTFVLEAEVMDRDVYPLNNTHPNSHGYRVIAETLNRHFDETPVSKRHKQSRGQVQRW
jgi:hypothetical protein